MVLQPAPAWHTTEWLNTAAPLTLDALRGKVILLEAFQMLCPGCVAHAIPQARHSAEVFADAPLAVIGLHTVFEHHAVTGPDALRAFVHEYRLTFPIGIDAPGTDGDPIPQTMRAYAMQGTPTTILIDAEGRLRRQVFGAVDDLWLGSEIGTLLAEASRPASVFTPIGDTGGTCAGGICTLA